MTEAKPQIGFQQIGLGAVLKQYRLAVPSNQREYSWGERQVTTLFRDFAKAITENEREYFLGTVVTIPRSADLLEVVDGQQRLATTAILLSQIKNYLADNNEPLIAEAINNGFLTEIDRDRRERVAKLQLNLDDNEYFRTMLSTPAALDAKPAKTSHELIRGAFLCAQKQVRAIVAASDPKDHGDILNVWLSFIEHNATVILLRVPTAVNAYKMFETLNDRGLKSSQSDMVKNYLFGQSAERLAEAQQKWTGMRGALESLDDEDISTVTYLRHALTVLRGYLRETEVYEIVQNMARGPQGAMTFLSNVSGLSSTYVASFNPEHEGWNSYPDSMRKSIRALNLLNSKPMRPLMLAVASKFAPKEAADAFTKFISWQVRLLIVGVTRTGGTIEVPFGTAARKVFLGEIADEKALSKELAPFIPTDEQFQRSFEVATVNKASLARYYLRALELTVKGESSPCFIPNDDRETINLEHVLPLEPDTNWPEFDQLTARADVKRLGNMALLKAKHNSDLRNSGFDVKRQAYEQTPYELTRQIASELTWSRERIAARQKTLASLALKTWPL